MYPSEPNVTFRSVYDDVESIEQALSESDPAKVGQSLVKIAKARFKFWKWLYDEVRQSRAMLAGAQYGYWDDNLNGYILEPETEVHDEVRLVCNIEKPIVDQATAILTQGDPIFGTYPGQAEIGDQAASEAADIIVRYLWRYDRMQSVFRRAARGAFAFGMTPVLEEWNEADGEYVPAGIGPDGLPVPEHSKGAGKTTVLQMDQIAFDPAALHCYDGDALIIREKCSPWELNERHPGKMPAPDGGRDQEDGRRESDAERFSPATGRNAPTRADGETPEPIDVYRFFVRKCSRYPFGAEIRVASDGTLLTELGRPNPVYPTAAELQRGEQWPNYAWPVVFYMGDERDGCPWGRGRIVDIHGLQKGFNGDLSKLYQHRAIIANTKILLPNNLDVEWDDMVGTVIRVPRNVDQSKIGYLTPPQVTQDAVQMLNAAQGFMEYVAGVGAATQGQAPSSDPSGRTLEQLQQRDYVRLEPIKRNLYTAAAQHMELKLRYFRRYATDDRKMIVVGENERVAVRFLNGAKLAAGTDVVAFNDTSLPSDPSKRILAILNLTTMLQSAPDEKWRVALLKLVKLHDFNGFFRTIDPHGDRWERIKRRILLGEKPQYLPWDNPMTAKAAMEDLLCSEEFEGRVEAEGGFDLDPMTGQFIAKGQMGQTAYALWMTATEFSTPQAPPAPPGASTGDASGSPEASTQAPPSEASVPTPDPMEQAA